MYKVRLKVARVVGVRRDGQMPCPPRVVDFSTGSDQTGGVRKAWKGERQTGTEGSLM